MENEIKIQQETVYIVKDAEGKDKKFFSLEDAKDFICKDYKICVAKLTKEINYAIEGIKINTEKIDELKDKLLPNIEVEIELAKNYDSDIIYYKTYLGSKEPIMYVKQDFTKAEWRGLKKSNILMLKLRRKQLIRQLNSLRRKREEYQYKLASLKNQLKATNDLEKLKNEGALC